MEYYRSEIKVKLRTLERNIFYYTQKKKKRINMYTVETTANVTHTHSSRMCGHMLNALDSFFIANTVFLKYA